MLFVELEKVIVGGVVVDILLLIGINCDEGYLFFILDLDVYF